MNTPEVITDEMIAQQQRDLYAQFDKLKKTALEIKAQRDQLLKSLRELVMLAEIGDADEDQDNWHPALQQARAAIARVTGEA